MSIIHRHARSVARVHRHARSVARVHRHARARACTSVPSSQGTVAPFRPTKTRRAYAPCLLHTSHGLPGPMTVTPFSMGGSRHSKSCRLRDALSGTPSGENTATRAADVLEATVHCQMSSPGAVKQRLYLVLIKSSSPGAVNQRLKEVISQALPSSACTTHTPRA